MEKKQLVPVSVKYLQGFLILRVVVLLDEIKHSEGIKAALANEFANIHSHQVAMSRAHAHRFALTSPDIHKFPLLLRMKVTPPTTAFLGVAVADLTPSRPSCK